MLTNGIQNAIFIYDFPLASSGENKQQRRYKTKELVMAYKNISKMSEAISIGPKPNEKKWVEGYLLGAKFGVGKTGKKKGNSIYNFESLKGERFDVWGNASINLALAPGEKLQSLLVGKLVKIEFVRLRDSGKGKTQQKVCDVFCDENRKKKLATGGETDYIIKT